MKPNEMIVLGLVVFIAIVVSELWIEYQRNAISELHLQSFQETQNQRRTIVTGFTGTVC